MLHFSLCIYAIVGYWQLQILISVFIICFYSEQTSPEVVKRWSNEVQEAVQSRAALVQFHALALLHQVSSRFVLHLSSSDIHL